MSKINTRIMETHHRNKNKWLELSPQRCWVEYISLTAIYQAYGWTNSALLCSVVVATICFWVTSQSVGRWVGWSACPNEIETIHTTTIPRGWVYCCGYYCRYSSVHAHWWAHCIHRHHLACNCAVQLQWRSPVIIIGYIILRIWHSVRFM